MAGFVLDIFISYVIKSLMDVWRTRGSARWPVVKGIVSSVDKTRWWSSPVVSIGYEYEVGGEHKQGQDEITFFRSSSAYNLRRKVHLGMPVRIRVNPSDADASFIALTTSFERGER